MTVAGYPVDNVQIDISVAKQLLARSPAATTSSFLFAVLTVALLSYISPIGNAKFWLVAVAAAACMPFAYIAIQKKYPFNADNIRKYLLFNSFNALVSGIVWGVGMVVLTDVSSDISIAITILAIFAYSTAAIVSHGAFPRSYAAAAGSALLIYGTFLITMAPVPESRFGYAAIIMFLLYLVIARNVSRATVANLTSQQQNQAMMKELKEQRDAVERSHEDKTRFLAATSHDLAQPLHAQGNYISALRSRLNRPEQYELLQKIEASWRSMGNMLDGLVDISKLESGAITINATPVDLSILIGNIADEFAHAANNKNIELHVRAERQFAETDAYLFSRILRNVLSNAVKFTQPGGEVLVSLTGAGDRLAVSVVDSGIGIPAESHSEIFDEYVQLDNPERDRQKGLGLGLSIVRRLCNLLEIDFDMKSEKSNGTSFTFYLPKCNKPETTGIATSEKLSALRLSVLVIDDERAILDSMSIMLSDWGCEVFCARSESEAVELIQTLDLSPDFIIADMRLRENATGTAAVAAIRSLLAKDIPAIVMTGNVDGIGDQALPAKAILLTKPVDAGTLYRELKNLGASDSASHGAQPVENSSS
ncbi:ATP-binding protein [Hoeflea sp. TYP-13]|uniref:hybrid sensor histidine kinase/response regulator n=1 Tax=Hoeflea sp. TYP-13 TaxID=3230023 RepID=UPI0034C61933